MSRRPKAFVLLSLLGAATPFQAASSSRSYPPGQTASLSISPGVDNSNKVSSGNNIIGQHGKSSELYAHQMPSAPVRGRPLRVLYSAVRTVGSRRQADFRRVLVRKDNGLVLQSTVAAPRGIDEEYRHRYRTIFSGLRGGAAVGAAASLRQTAAGHEQTKQIGKYTAMAALGVGAIEVFARLVGVTAGGNTLLLPSALAPTLDASTAVLSVVLGPLFTVKFWSTVAPFASIALKLSPMPTIQQIRRQRTTGGLPLLPYSAMCTMTFALVAYGLLIQDVKVIATHGAGHLISLYYCLMFYKHVDKEATNLPGTVGMHARTGLSIAAATALTIVALGKRAAPVVGMTTVILSCLMYTGPLAALKQAIQSKSAQNIPLPYAVASSINALAWLVYGYFGIHDFMIYAPCLIGFVSATAQIVVNILYGNGPENGVKEA